MSTAEPEGIVTLEDLLEEIVGEIEDEFDPPETSVTVNSDGSYVFSGLLTPAEAGRYVPELDQLKEDDDYDTIAGFVLSLLGHIPEADERPVAIYDNLKFTVLEMADRRIARIKLEILDEESVHENEAHEDPLRTPSSPYYSPQKRLARRRLTSWSTHLKRIAAEVFRTKPCGIV